MAETDQRVALITGCGKENGIGAATAQKLARDGYIVAVSDVAAAGVDNDNSVEKAASKDLILWSPASKKLAGPQLASLATSPPKMVRPT